MSPSRDAAVARFRRLVGTIETDRLPVPVRAVWVHGDAALGMDPVDRLGVYLIKSLPFEDGPDREPAFAERLGVEGVGRTVSAAWPERHPNRVRANDDGHAAPEWCLAAPSSGTTPSTWRYPTRASRTRSAGGSRRPAPARSSTATTDGC